jgi:protein phosphatase
MILNKYWYSKYLIISKVGHSMDRIAIISDIHGNIPALEAVLYDIRNRGINRIICLGDLAGKGPGSDTAVDMVKSNCEIVLKGNWDYIISDIYDSELLLWHYRKLGEERIEYLKQLPLFAEFYLSGRLVRLCHAAPDNVFNRVQSYAPLEDKLKLFMPHEGSKEEAAIFGYGDIHGAYVQNFNGKTIFNVGSVGNPLEINQSSYGILEGYYGSEELSSFSINLVRVPYDIEKAVQQAIDSDMPEIMPYIKELRTAVFRGVK